ncbi:MAG: 4-hydroxyphenylpyruvate dioxygenase, partial [Alphaproteobacteria bacterium]|nr:4-hydroxyphenylpyruvate dioxygenase [Alphaproteobacteria bacterium]
MASDVRAKSSGSAVQEGAQKPAPGSLWDNPMGTDGFEFVEYAAPDPAALGSLFEQMGFTRVARHRSKDVSLYRQGDVNFILN